MQVNKLKDSLEIRELEIRKLKNAIIQKDQEISRQVRFAPQRFWFKTLAILLPCYGLEYVN